MFKTNKEISYEVPGNGLIALIPEGSICELATNLPKDRNGKPQYWLAEQPECWRGDFQKDSWFRNYGFLIADEDIEKSGEHRPKLNLYFIRTDNGESYEDHSESSFVVLAQTPDEAKEILAQFGKEHNGNGRGYGADWAVDALEELGRNVQWDGMPTVPTVVY